MVTQAGRQDSSNTPVQQEIDEEENASVSNDDPDPEDDAGDELSQYAQHTPCESQQFEKEHAGTIGTDSGQIDIRFAAYLPSDEEGEEKEEADEQASELESAGLGGDPQLRHTHDPCQYKIVPVPGALRPQPHPRVAIYDCRVKIFL
ncbi:hypothetical protein V7S43_013641 [Phytophthora oleae]|uniref:Uncharacterized protein n=1 Tax=Phytophthora oleae TaxID=2107226 RepID=A0ABD3F3W2_9STRA